MFGGGGLMGTVVLTLFSFTFTIWELPGLLVVKILNVIGEMVAVVVVSTA